MPPKRSRFFTAVADGGSSGTPPAQSTPKLEIDTASTVKGHAATPAPDKALLEKAAKIAKQLGTMYPNPPIPLDHETPFQLLVAVILSAQSTDKKVNEITPGLFKLAPDAQQMAALDVLSIQEAIKAIGLSKTKANNIHRTANMLVEMHGGEVPRTFEELEALPGVGHKTASVVMAQVFGFPSFPVDTHIHRLAQRWGLTCGKNVEKTEKDLKAIFPEVLWNDLHLQIIYFGREHCPAKAHDPVACPICSWAAVPPYDQPGASPLKPGQKRQASPPAKGKVTMNLPAIESKAKKSKVSKPAFDVKLESEEEKSDKSQQVKGSRVRPSSRARALDQGRAMGGTNDESIASRIRRRRSR